jgi:hypothetical protein
MLNIEYTYVTRPLETEVFAHKRAGNGHVGIVNPTRHDEKFVVRAQKGRLGPDEVTMEEWLREG